MYKNIVICLDGTGNEIERCETNVLRLFRLLKNQPDDPRTPSSKQVEQHVFYHPGVGTMGRSGMGLRLVQKAQEIMGLAFGLGLEADVLRAYGFLCERYRDREKDEYGNVSYEGDRIYLFGFSRGAYAARVLAGFIHLFGLVHPSKLHLAVYAFRAYRRISDHHADPDNDTSYENINKFDKILKPIHAPIRFLGIWDTVNSMIRFEPSIFSLIDYGHHPCVSRNTSVSKIRHAVSIDEKRSMFRNYPWTKGQTYYGNRFKNGDGIPQDLKQVWFAGYHSDVGGGALEQESGLSKITLKWMLDELTDGNGKCELELRRSYHSIVLGEPPDNGALNYATPDYKAKIHDSVKLAWRLLEYFPKLGTRRRWQPHTGHFPYYLPRSEPRVIPKDAEIHPSALERYHDAGVNWKPVNLTRYLEAQKHTPKT